MIAFGNNQISPGAQQNARTATKDLVAAVMLPTTPRRKAIDYLREEDCYVALNYIVNTIGVTAPSHGWAVDMMRESLYADRTMPYTDRQGVAHPKPKLEIGNMADGQCQLSNMFLSQATGDAFAYVPANYPPFAESAADLLKWQKKWTQDMCMAQLERREREVDPPVLAPPPDQPPPQPDLAQVVAQQLVQAQQNAANPPGPRFLGGADGHTNNVWGVGGHRNPDRHVQGE